MEAPPELIEPPTVCRVCGEPQPTSNWPSPLPKGDALPNRGRHGAGEFRLVVEQRIVPGGHWDRHSGFQIAQPAQLTDHPASNLLKGHGNVGIAGWFGFDKAGLETGVAAIEVDALKKDDVKMEIQEVIVKLAPHIVGQAFGIGVVVERGKKRLQVFRDHVVEHGAARIPGFVGGNSWSHESTHVQHGGYRDDRKCHWLYYTYEHYSREIRRAAQERQSGTHRLAASAAARLPLGCGGASLQVPPAQVHTPSHELAPVIEQLNRLRQRLDAAFDRKRQFSGAVAHELRTPLAELLTLSDVNLRWPEESM